MSKQDDRRRLIRAYKEETGAIEIDMHDLAHWAVRKGWPLPQPKAPLDILANEFAEAAREETEIDPNTGQQYRVYHCVPVIEGQLTLFHWIDIHEAPRQLMERSLVARRNQMIGDGVQLTFDAMFWNSINPADQPIELSMNFSLEIAQRVRHQRRDSMFRQAAEQEYDEDHATL